MKLKVKNMDVMDSCDSARAISAAWEAINSETVNLEYKGAESAIDEIERVFPCWESDGHSEHEIKSILIETRLTYVDFYFEDEFVLFIVNVEKG